MAKNYTILGQGAIGSFIAHLFHQNHITFNVSLRDEAKYRTVQYFVDLQNQEHCFNSALLTSHQSIQNVLLPLKAYDVKAAFDKIKHRLSPDACIILLNNGMGVAETLITDIKPNQTLLLGSVTHGVLIQQNKIIHTGAGSIQLGFANPAKKPQPCAVKKLLSNVPTIEWQTNIRQTLWTKLAINACINPITGLNQLQNSSVLKPQYKKLIQHVCEEIVQVAKIDNIELNTNQLIKTVNDVAYKTGNNYSSMRQDIANSRRTEIEHINGYIVKMGQKQGVSTPYNQDLFEQVNTLKNA